MAERYTEYHFIVTPKEPWEEILFAQLQLLPFESFLSSEEGLKAYLPTHLNSHQLLKEVALFKEKRVSITYSKKNITPENWNAKWESSFQPVMIGENCVIRADFHPPQGKTYELIINPKMSFGTGHHPTTLMMAEYALEEKLQNARVLDMGCGTGVLAILASKKGASKIEAIDIDPWCIENTTENAWANACTNIYAFKASQLSTTKAEYDIIFANINRNILLEQIPSYSKALTEKGRLLLSGFYTEDELLLEEQCKKENLTLVSRKENELWVALKFQKY
ncbi:MAG: 50S ribosomal protein L11 methyltransferase [Flavobacteriaceae bacterium]